MSKEVSGAFAALASTGSPVDLPPCIRVVSACGLVESHSANSAAAARFFVLLLITLLEPPSVPSVAAPPQFGSGATAQSPASFG